MRALETQFYFAGFAWPRYVARMAIGPAALKRKHAARHIVGEYFHAPNPENAGKGRGFYLDSDGQPFARWKWADDAYSRISHCGYFTDEHGDSEKIRGIVVMLPHGRCLAGWSMGDGMASSVECSPVFENERQAAMHADMLAERAAERERDYQAAQALKGEA